ncbi:MAG: tripartite tricarboxylate transporter substrate binding protein [Limnochordia bacterium]|jgi:tripartite-type tricarboxylate transporter receptor subunit TctC
MRKLSFFLVVALLIMTLSVGVLAEWKPNRAITMIVGWTAGGTSDTVARALAFEMSEYLGVPIQVTNVDGANGGIAGQRVALSRADGYTLFGGTQLHGTWPIMGQADVGWESFYPFTAGMGGTTIYVRGDSPYNDLNDLVEAIKKSDKVVNFGSTSAGGNGSIFGNAFAEAAGIADKVREIPYQGGRDAGRYLLSGEVEFVSVSLGDIADWAEAGQVRPIANLYHSDFVWRGVTFPSITHYYPELEIYSAINPYWGFSVHRDTPEEIVVKLAEAFVHAVKTERFQEALDSRGIILAPMMGVVADQVVSKVSSARGWPQYELGIIDNSPANFDVPKIQDWSWPPNAAAANARPWPAKIEELYKAELAQYNE